MNKDETRINKSPIKELDIPEEDWTITEGGFSKIEIEVDQDIIDNLMTMWVESNCQPASIEQYHDELKTKTIEQAIYSAVFNDIAINAIQRQVTHIENARTE